MKVRRSAGSTGFWYFLSGEGTTVYAVYQDADAVFHLYTFMEVEERGWQLQSERSVQMDFLFSERT